MSFNIGDNKLHTYQFPIGVESCVSTVVESTVGGIGGAKAEPCLWYGKTSVDWIYFAFGYLCLTH